jgi:arylsulfatase A-like enzyme
MSARSRLTAAGRWIAPSVIAAALGVAVAGAVENADQGYGAVGAIAAAGFAAMLALPACLAGALAVRGLWAAWRPARLAPALVEDGGGAPRLAAWVVFLTLGTLVLSWSVFNGVRLLSKWTTFKVNVVSLGAPIFAITAALALAALSRPLVDALSAGLRALDARLRRRLGRSLLTPRAILGATLTAAAALVVGAWFLTIKPRIGPLDVDIALYPALAITVTAAVHPVWRRLRPRVAALALAAPAAAAALAMIGGVVHVRLDRPSLMLEIWSAPTVAGLSVETVFDVDVLRSAATLEAYRPRPRPGAPRRDIVLVTIDTMRYDRTPLAKGPASMPTLKQLAERAAVFERAFAPSNVTRRSMPAMMLGASPPRIRGRVVGWALRLDPRHVPLAERFAAAGYATAGFFCCGSFWDPDKKTGYSRGLASITIDQDGEVLATEARKYLEARYAAAPDAKAAQAADVAPTFTWLHFIEPHNWMKRKDAPDAADKGKDSRQRRYDRALGEVDGYLAELVAAIDAIPEDRRPILVVTSDHGEGLGDHGALYHSSDLYDSQLRVPLVVAVPGVPARRIPETVSLTDLAPTLLDLAGFEPPTLPDMDGRSLADLVTGARAPDPDGGLAYAVMLKDRSSSQEAYAVVRGRHKLIDGPKGIELYDLVADPKEAKNLADEQPELRAELEAVLAERRALDARPPFQRWEKD